MGAKGLFKRPGTISRLPRKKIKTGNRENLYPKVSIAQTSRYWLSLAMPLAMLFRMVRIPMTARCTSTGSWPNTLAT